MTPRSRMTSRATIMRNMQENKDPYGHKTPIAMGIVGSNIPCAQWYKYGTTGIMYSDTVSVPQAQLVVIMPLGTNVIIGDIISEIRNQLDVVLHARLKVIAKMRRFNHLECRTQENA